MKNVKKKGFTIVELVIVVAVIAILAAVLIPTFSDLVKKANMSSDEVAVRNMNTILAAEQVMDDNIKDVSKVRSILAQAGYNSDNLVPLSKDYKFYWSSTYNVVLLVNCESENKEEWQVVYPTEGYERAIEEFEDFDNHSVTIFNLANLPYADVTRTDNKSLETGDISKNSIGPFPGSDLTSLTLDTSLHFVAKDTPEEASKQEYGPWIVDFVITSNKDLAPYIEEGISFYLAGQYETYSTQWVVINIDDLGVEAGVPYNLLKSFATFTYVDICSYVKSFQCGIAARGGFPTDLSITVQLAMYTTDDNYKNGNIDYVIYEYTYTYK